MIKDITILGDGGWGTTLAIHLAHKGYNVKLWGPFPDYIRYLDRYRINKKFLPGIKIPRSIQFSSELAVSLKNSDLAILALPSKFALKLIQQLKTLDLSKEIFLSVIKGIEENSLKTISQIITEECGRVPLAVLSGPTIAMEVAQGLPSTAVIAAKDIKLAKTLQTVFNSPTFRIYTNTDVIGVEMGGSIKNVIAIACGVCDGLGFGSNTKAAVLTRGLAEMTRLGTAMGARPQTFFGLSGLGDLVTTCISPRSRNRSVGEKLGQGKSIQHITRNMDMVAEGISTVKALFKLAQQFRVEMPITNAVYRIIYKGQKSHQAVTDLMNRKIKSE